MRRTTVEVILDPVSSGKGSAVGTGSEGIESEVENVVISQTRGPSRANQVGVPRAAVVARLLCTWRSRGGRCVGSR